VAERTAPPRPPAQASAASGGSLPRARTGHPLTPAPSPLWWLRSPAGPFYLLLGCTLILLVMGLTMVLSASSANAMSRYGSPYTVAAKQATWAAIGLPLGWAASRLPANAYRRLAYPVLVVALLLVQVPGLGRQVNGSTNWLALGPITVQPSELAKLALVLWGADLLARKKALLDQWRHLVVPLAPVGVILLALVLVGGDLGTSIVMVAILGALLFLAGAPGRIFAIFGATTLAGVAAMIALEPYRLARVTTLFNPSADPTGAGYQGLQGHYALAGGGWWGVGLGASREKWGLLPGRHLVHARALRAPGLRRVPGRRRQQGPVRPARRRRRDHLADRPDAGQHRGRDRAGAHHRHPLAVDLLRRVSPGAEPDHTGDAPLLRPHQHSCSWPIRGRKGPITKGNRSAGHTHEPAKEDGSVRRAPRPQACLSIRSLTAGKPRIALSPNPAAATAR